MNIRHYTAKAVLDFRTNSGRLFGAAFGKPRSFEFSFQFLAMFLPRFPLQTSGKVICRRLTDTRRQGCLEYLQLRLNFPRWSKHAHLSYITHGWTQSSITNDHLHETFSATPRRCDLSLP